MPQIDLSILNQRQTPAFYASSLATRPAFGFAGRIFIDTDSPSTGLYRDTGAAWVQIADPGAGTTGTLQQVTTNGNTTSQGINITAGGLSSNIVTIVDNGLSSKANYIGQTMATNDNWKIYGTGSIADQGEMVFELGDNGAPISPNGQKFRFSYDASSSGTSKDAFIVDYDSSNFNTNLIVSSGNNLGVGVSVPSGLIHADGGASAARMIIDADNGIARIFSFRTDNLPRWALRVDGTETGSNVGGDFTIRRYDDTGAFVDAPLLITRSTGQSTFAKKVVIENNAGDQQLQIVSTTAPSIRLDNSQTGATKRAGFGISTATNNFIQGSADRDFCMFNGSTTASSILFGVYDAGAGNVQEAARISPARNFLIGTTTDAGQKLYVNGTALINNILTVNNNIITSGQLSFTASTTQTAGSIARNAFYGLTLYGIAGTNSDFGLVNSLGNEVYKVPTGTINSVFSGNTGIGITPSAWGAFKPSLQVGSASLSQIANRAYLTANGYFDGTNWTYIDTDFASQYFQQNSQHIWNTAASGTAGNTISFTQAMTLASTGNLLIGTTTDNGNKLQVNGELFASGDDFHSFIVQDGTAQIKLERTTSNAGLMYIGADSVGFRVFDSGFATRLTLTNGGNLLIGTSTNGGSKLRIVGLPTSAAGLSSGDIYSNLGILTIVP